MFKEEALKKYGKKYPVISEYCDADTFFMANENDPHLHPIKIDLLEPPDWSKIDGFGLKPKLQKIQKFKIPEGLKKVEKLIKQRLQERNLINKQERISGQKILAETYNYILERKTKFAAELAWIQKMWWHVDNGYWFFNNGKPTYIDGWHFMYLNFWNLDVGLPEYRDIDRRFVLFARDCFTTKKDIFGNEFGHRTCAGFIKPKKRREGITYLCLCILYCITIDGKNRQGGIQSFDEDNAESHFQMKLVPAWQKLPFFFKPTWQGFESPREALLFSKPLSQVIGDELGSKIDFATTTKNKIYYDGEKLYAGLFDEGGKRVISDICEEWSVLVHCFSQGNRSDFHGLAMFPSTVAEMSEKGGKAYSNLASQSHAERVNPATGQTLSGLRNVFFPAYDGMENFIDEYGMSVIDTPTPEQAAFIKRNIGAKEYLMTSREQYLKENTLESMAAYRKECSEYPMTWADCWRTKEGNLGFDYEKIDKNLLRLQHKRVTQRGNFAWSGMRDVSNVVWIPDPNGKFIKSLNIDPKDTNRKFRDGGHYYPEFPEKGVCGSDPYGFMQTREFVTAQKDEKDYEKKSKQSYGGLAAFQRRDKNIDPDSKDIKEWETHRFILTYQARPFDDDEFAEDALMMCVYLGYMMNTETNKELVWKHFIKRGYGGYLLYLWDEKENKPKERPGVHESSESKQSMFRGFDKYIKHHLDREQHIEFMQWLKDIKGIEQLTRFDGLTACGLCLLAIEDTQFDVLEESKNNFTDVGQFFTEYEV